jgi:hypothetical protein
MWGARAMIAGMGDGWEAQSVSEQGVGEQGRAGRPGLMGPRPSVRPSRRRRPLLSEMVGGGSRSGCDVGWWGGGPCDDSTEFTGWLVCLFFFEAVRFDGYNRGMGWDGGE